MRAPQVSRASRAIEDWLKNTPDGEPKHSQERLAALITERLGRPFSQSSISHIARGQQLPRADVIGVLRAVLGIEPEWWIPDAPGSGPLDADETGPRKAQSGSMSAVDVKPTGS